jgi:FlaA1/EpsC-like NDP-sugar epimerase
MLAQIYAREYNARFMSVRFGNVVGSVGSVIPLFQKQIQRGGPVTVTHREATRYFMTIPEASRLILQAGAIGRGGEIFVLKMGTPIRIADMARDLIRLSGFKPDEDIEIKEIGLRPGEKLFEELITQGEGIQETEHEEIMVLRSDNHVSMQEMNRHIEKLVKLAQAADAKGIKEELKRVVPEYEPQDTESML